MSWPSRRMELWGESPGSRVNVKVYWPRYLWVKPPYYVEKDDRWYPGDFATLTEQLRASDYEAHYHLVMFVTRKDER